MAGPPTPSTLIVYGFTIVIAIVLMCVSVGTRYWLTTEISLGSSDVHRGLFEVCSDTLDTCVTIPDDKVKEYLRAVRGLCLTALCLYLLTVVIMGHLVFIKKMTVQNKTHGWLAMWISFAAVILAIAGPVRFIAEWVSNDAFNIGFVSFGYSPFLSLASAFMGFWAGVFAMVAVSTLCRVPSPALHLQPVVYSATPGMQVVAPATSANPTTVPAPYTVHLPNNQQPYPYHQGFVPVQGYPYPQPPPNQPPQALQPQHQQMMPQPPYVNAQLPQPSQSNEKQAPPNVQLPQPTQDNEKLPPPYNRL